MFRESVGDDLEAGAAVQREIHGTKFIVASGSMQRFMAMVERVAGHTETVLITGETGSGKELIACSIHEFSYRNGKPWIDINCAALPEHLVESELFGYEKGAFSGADTSKPGLFELADKGTLFLDEIGELPSHIQVKLLRVLDGAAYYRLGGHRKITVDVRIVAATNQDLEAAVREGRFRKDLFHRLSQFELRVPPLRERPEDVVALAEHFLRLKSAEMKFSPEALRALQTHSWPGNVRELRNIVAKVAMASSGPEIGAVEVLAEFSASEQQKSDIALPSGDLQDMERQMVMKALENTGGHRAKAAEQLGISRRTLTRKLGEYKITPAFGDKSRALGALSLKQKKFFRAKVKLPVVLKDSQGHETQVTAVNLSVGGMGLEGLPDPRRSQGLMDIRFLLPDGQTPIEAKVQIVWADLEGRAGATFVVIEPAVYKELQEWTNQRMKEEGWELPL
ncbi:MAG TPA: sigma 54-interacting transcriptional regulator [Terriglobales bacterium]|nr:sigma 54-interacting transcriptional regulator [Terriglobales bacterium]